MAAGIRIAQHCHSKLFCFCILIVKFYLNTEPWSASELWAMSLALACFAVLASIQSKMLQAANSKSHPMSIIVGEKQIIVGCPKQMEQCCKYSSTPISGGYRLFTFYMTFPPRMGHRVPSILLSSHQPCEVGEAEND